MQSNGHRFGQKAMAVGAGLARDQARREVVRGQGPLLQGSHHGRNDDQVLVVRTAHPTAP